jgi:hypothetical protein
MRTGDSHAQRLGSVESSATNERGLHAKRVRAGKAIFCGKVKRSKKEHDAPEAEDEAEKDALDNEVDESGRACRQKGWWKRGDVDAMLNTVNMTAWVHKMCDIMGEEALIKPREAWHSSEQKDECIVRLDDLKRGYWMGTEVGQLGGYGFQGVTLGVDGSCKDGKMGSGCCKFREEGAGKCARVCREEGEWRKCAMRDDEPRPVWMSLPITLS